MNPQGTDLLALLRDAGLLSDFDAAREAVFAREGQMSTGMEAGSSLATAQAAASESPPSVTSPSFGTPPSS